MKPYPEYKTTGLPWLPKIPKHWEVVRAKQLFCVVDVRSERGEEELLSVSERYGVVKRENANVTMFMANSYEGYKLCWPDDLAVNSLWAWSYGLGVSQYHGIISTAYSVYRLKDKTKTLPRYFDYFVRGKDFHWELRVRSKGLWKSRYQLSDDSFLSAPMILPPVDEQAKIVRYLDAMTAKIDKLIAAKKKQIALLQEKKQAVINQAVTRGLNPDVDLKDSGIDWLGKIPKHWDCLKIREIFSERNQKVSDKDYAPLSVSKGGIVPQLETVAKTENGDNRKLVRVGDFVINSRSDRKSSSGISLYDGSVSLINIVLKPRISNGLFLHYLLKCHLFVEEFYRNGRGIVADLWTTRLSEMKGISIPLPPADEQVEIVRYLDVMTAKIDKSIEVYESHCRVLAEYKDSLVSSIVTGVVDVCEIETSSAELMCEEVAGMCATRD